MLLVTCLPQSRLRQPQGCTWGVHRCRASWFATRTCEHHTVSHTVGVLNMRESRGACCSWLSCLNLTPTELPTGWCVTVRSRQMSRVGSGQDGQLGGQQGRCEVAGRECHQMVVRSPVGGGDTHEGTVASSVQFSGDFRSTKSCVPKTRSPSSRGGAQAGPWHSSPAVTGTPDTSADSSVTPCMTFSL